MDLRKKDNLIKMDCVFNQKESIKHTFKIGRGEKNLKGELVNVEWFVKVDTGKDKFLGKTKHSYFGILEEYEHKMTPEENHSKIKTNIYYSYSSKSGEFDYNGYFSPPKEDFIK
tara:strand:+ start:118 stop:459 length:342 start_codon:yes stop_codon:yes gene_type:complete